MSIFGKIMDKILGRSPAAAAPAPAARPAAAPGVAPVAKPAVAAAPAGAAPVDVEAVLSQMAGGAAGGGGNWRTSIVDLLKLLDLDSDMAARRELAEELGVHAGEHGSAEQNIALHKAVMAKLAANGGKVPASMQD
ncbi:DUF3597 family protein [Glacieibacterium frigidum]|uniref:DUF3597 domain-containing protein n=1 Tax=Glacieibacterium frigidum TaxID=2593303 RepID=A0A552UFP2_9SPHN|nr:DUF3597 family protein [Glacieibacterium frigidum]TRW17042.1 DUF3597 domain-containing protein [Glacieibacterium frigidum]